MPQQIGNRALEAAADREQEHHDERPDDVELFLDRQRPEMREPERNRREHRVEPEVEAMDGRKQQAVAFDVPAPDDGISDDSGPDHVTDGHGPERGQQAEGPPFVEPRHVKSSSLRLFTE